MPPHRPVRRRKSVSHYTDDNPSTFTVKPKRGETPTAAAATATAPKRVRKVATAAPPTPPSPLPTRKRKRIRILHDPKPTAADDILAHATAVQPVVHVPYASAAFSSATTTTTVTTTTSSSSSCAASACLGVTTQQPPPPLSTWQNVPSAYRGPLLRRRGAGGTHVTVPPPAATAWATRPDGSFAVGDCAGGVALYAATAAAATVQNQRQAVTLLRTTAWKREQERALLSKKVVSWPNAVSTVTWKKMYVATLTAVELEVWSLMNVSKQPKQHYQQQEPVILVTLNLASSSQSSSLHRPQAFLDVLPPPLTDESGEGVHLLWTTGGRSLAASEDDIINNNTNNTNGDAQTLVRIHVGSSSASDTAKQATILLPGFSSYTAIWDETTEQDPADPVALVLARNIHTNGHNNDDDNGDNGDDSNNEDSNVNTGSVHLIRYQTTSRNIQLQVPATWIIKSPKVVADVRLHQFGDYTFVTGGNTAPGIQMLDSNTLTVLQTFGAAVALHGKTVQWHSCQWVRAPSVVRSGGNKKKLDGFVEWADALALPSSSDDDDESDNNNKNATGEHWLIGVPHPFKGPDELQSTLYVWNASGIEVTTLPSPAGGCLGLVCQDRKDRGWELVGASAETGELWEWRASLQSNFAGVMYPVGYQVVDNNIEYIEDEDELDQRIEVLENEDDFIELPVHPQPMKGVDDELARALELSLLEQALTEDVVILPEDEEDESMLIPCRPDPALTSHRKDTDNMPQAVQSPEPSRKDGFVSDAFLALPQTRLVRQHFRHRKAQRDALVQQPRPQEVTDVPAPPRIKGKRTKVANVEALLQASIKPELRRRMEEIQAGLLRPSPEEKELALELLLLSPASKACSSPVDVSHAPGVPQPKNGLSGELKEVVETPSDGNASTGSKEKGRAVAPESCPACRGRMVLHICGRRDKPIDYEAIEREERERKAKEEEEKHKARQAKRRAADAKRREARKKKKEEEERKRREEEENRRAQEERMRRLEADQFERANIQEHEEEPVAPFGRTPARSMYQAAYDPTSATSGQGDYYIDSTAATDGGYSSQAWSHHNRRGSGQAPSDSYSAVSSSASARQEPLRIDGAEVKPSTSLKASDALAALAGLADSLPAAATPVANVQDAFPPAPASWYSSAREEPEPQPPAQDTGSTFVYRGSQERRAAIAQAFLGNFEIGSSPVAATAESGDNDYSGAVQKQEPSTSALRAPEGVYNGVQQEAYNDGVQLEAYNGGFQQEAYSGVQQEAYSGVQQEAYSGIQAQTGQAAAHNFGSQDGST